MGLSNPDKKDPITREGLLQSFSGFGDDAERTSGGENEMMLSDINFALPNDEIHLELTGPYRNQKTGDVSEEEIVHYSDEPGTHMIEVKNDGAYVKANLIKSPLDIWRQKSLITARMDGLGLKLSPFSCMPFSSNEACLNSIIGPRGEGADYSDRPRTMLKAFEMHLGPEAVAYPVVNDCVHWTTNARNPQDAFVMARLQVAMSPFWFIYTENRPPYQNDNPDVRVNHHSGLRSRRALGNRGMYPDFLFAAKDHSEFVDRTIERILDTSMLAYYDHDGQIVPAPKGGMELKPNDMKGLGPENISQFEMGMSQFWYNYKIKGIPGGEGTLFERRDFDEGPEVFQDVMLLCSMIDYDDVSRQRLIQALETDYGIPLFSDPETAHGVIRANIDAALRRGADNARFVDTPFGASNLGKTVHNFLNDTLLPMMENFHRETGMSDMLHSWRYKAENRTTNAQVWYDLFDDMEAQRGFIRELIQEDSYHDRFTDGRNWGEQIDEILGSQHQAITILER